MKKQTKTSAQNAPRIACCSTRQKVWGIIALAGLFTCGFMVGYALRRPAADAVAPVPAAVSDLRPTCVVIEELILSRIYPEDNIDMPSHLANADNYSLLVERGCPENAERFKALALRELEIASALQSEKYFNEDDATIVIDTYKKLDMQREAQQFLDKMQKLTNPAIDFILQMQQIINEQ